MSFFAVLVILIVLYYAVQIFLWIVLDCDISLFLLTFFGKPISFLKGKVIWITGASSGIGRELAKVLAKNGAKLVISGRNVTELELTKQECLELAGDKLTPDDILILSFDVLDFNQHQECFNRVLQHFHALDILVNNAGRAQIAEWNKIDINVDRELFELDVFSVVNLSRIAVTHFEQNTIQGQIAVTSSTAGLIGSPKQCSYTGAKHAIHGYFESLRTEKPHINVNLYCPGPTVSNFLQECFVETPGQKFNRPIKKETKKMSTERCAQLYAIALVNNVDLSWSGVFPINLVNYSTLYYSNLTKLFTKIVGVERLRRLINNKLK